MTTTQMPERWVESQVKRLLGEFLNVAESAMLTVANEIALHDHGQDVERQADEIVSSIRKLRKEFVGAKVGDDPE